jgi:hypothetical protein
LLAVRFGAKRNGRALSFPKNGPQSDISDGLSVSTVQRA